MITHAIRHHLASMGPELSPWSLRAGRPSLATGVVVAVTCVGLATLVIYPLTHVAPFVSLSVVYLPAVVVVSAYWGLRLGLATATTMKATRAAQSRRSETLSVPVGGRWKKLNAAALPIAVVRPRRRPQ